MTDVRDRILDAADELLARFGYRKMTIDDLARRAGIGKGSIYLHFRSKQEVALSTVDRIVDQVVDRLREIATEDSPVESRLRRMLLARVLIRFDAVRHYPESVNELLGELRSELLQRREDYFRRETRVFAAVVAEGDDSGELDASETAEVARTLLIATNAMLPYNLSVKELGRRSDTKKKVERVADLCLRGLLVDESITKTLE